MQNKYIWLSVSIIFLMIMLFGNRKVRLFAVIKEQMHVFKNAKTKKKSFWDFTCFIVFPFVVSFIFVYKLDIIIDDDLASLLTTVFSIIFTVLFGFAAIMISKIDSQNNIEKQVAEETFVSIVSSTILSLAAAILSIILTQTRSAIFSKLLSIGIISVSLITTMLLLMITKRTFFLYVDNKD